MPLELEIQEWTIEHDRNVRGLIRMNGMNHNTLYPSDRFPQQAMVVGNNWFYIADIGYLNGNDVTLGGGQKLKWSEAFTIVPKTNMQTRRYVPLEKILGDFKKQLRPDELALFPLGDQREQEAGQLGIPTKTLDDWYEVMRDDKRIKIFTATPRFESAIGQTSDGQVVGLSTYNRNPFEN